jgi:predicted nuclease of predicted toxin-antitoxin system
MPASLHLPPAPYAAAPRIATDQLRAAGQGPEVIALAEREGRVLLTFDKDFGEIAFRSPLSPRCGIVLLRFVPRDPDDAASVVTAALAMRADRRGRLAVVERDRLRVRRLPSTPRP